MLAYINAITRICLDLGWFAAGLDATVTHSTEALSANPGLSNPREPIRGVCVFGHFYYAFVESPLTNVLVSTTRTWRGQDECKRRKMDKTRILVWASVGPFICGSRRRRVCSLAMQSNLARLGSADPLIIRIM
ncbi:hypothetical protein BC835DRAFT_966264 [Cytidiella melzeri]|nr:hypothetical protein BC835DRAFT_966264 [Cytidiella melzeri]